MGGVPFNKLKSFCSRSRAGVDGLFVAVSPLQLYSLVLCVNSLQHLDCRDFI